MNDIERLKNVLSDLAILRDGLVETDDFMSDVVAATLPAELETDPAGHKQLRDVALQIRDVVNEIEERANDLRVKSAQLAGLARI
jgi:hypothetical protein